MTTRYKYTNADTGYLKDLIRFVQDGDVDDFTGGFTSDFTYYVEKDSKPSKKQLDDLNTKGYCMGKRIDQFTVVF